MRSSKIYRNNYVLYQCDGKCDIAWGISARPTIQISNDPDDVRFMGDDELIFNLVPFSDIIEGDAMKPNATNVIIHNKWCIRQCERIVESISDDRLGPGDVSLILNKKYNIKILQLKNGWYNTAKHDSNNIINDINDLTE